MSEKLCLQWNDFPENIKTAFRNLREENNFADVTLACEDDQQVEAHKVILAASSPFFQKIFERTKHPHPIIYLRGLTSEDISAIVDFLYFGEAKVYQENLDSFLAAGEEFQVKGLMGKRSEKFEDFDEKTPTLYPFFNTNGTIPKNSFKGQISENLAHEENRTVAIPLDSPGNMLIQQLGEKVKSMMEKSQNTLSYNKSRAYICQVCGKEGAHNAIKDHIEANHLEGISLPCSSCDKTFRSRKALRRHKCVCD